MRAVSVGWIVVLAALSPVWTQSTVAVAAPVCGNSVIEPPETCDDGNVSDGDGCSAACQIENLPPDCTHAEPGTDELWPPNHKFAEIVIDGVTDPEGDPVVITVTGVRQDEPSDATGDGATCADATGVGTPTAGLRAERSGQGDGRVYHVAFQATDPTGGKCVGEVLVCVPHDRGHGGTCIDQGALYDSIGGVCPAPPCNVDDCVPSSDELGSCADALPPGVALRLARARAALARSAETRSRRRARRLARRAARLLHAAAAAAPDDLPPECATLRTRLASGEACATCQAGED